MMTLRFTTINDIVISTENYNIILHVCNFEIDLEKKSPIFVI